MNIVKSHVVYLFANSLRDVTPWVASLVASCLREFESTAMARQSCASRWQPFRSHLDVPLVVEGPTSMELCVRLCWVMLTVYRPACWDPTVLWGRGARIRSRVDGRLVMMRSWSIEYRLPIGRSGE